MLGDTATSGGRFTTTTTTAILGQSTNNSVSVSATGSPAASAAASASVSATSPAAAASAVATLASVAAASSPLSTIQSAAPPAASVVTATATVTEVVPPTTASAAATAAAGSATAFPELPIRLRGITGYQQRVNDVVYCPPLQRADDDDEPTCVVYFGGDVQDFTENMETNRDSKSYIKYNLEATALLLRQGFPKAHIAVIRPARMEFKTFSCFDNFVRGNNAGVPDHTPMHNSLQHLEKLLHSSSQRLFTMQPTDQPAAQHNNTSSIGNNAQPTSSSPQATTAAASANNHSQQQQSPQPNDTQDMDIDIVQVQDTVNSVSMDTTTNTANQTTGTNGTNNAAVDCSSSTGNGSHASASPAASSSADNNGTTSTNSDNDKHDANNHLAAAAAGDSKLNATGRASAANHQNQDAADTWWWRESLNLDKCKLILIGFSKGCVVLNQFIYEFHYLKTLTPDDLTMIRLLSRIRDMYWLDGGHGGAKNTWITSRSLLETLTRLAIQIHVHVTPYQVQDERRPWIRREEKTFVELLRRLGAPLQRCLHFDTSSANLFTHFEVLQVFRQPSPHPVAPLIRYTYDDDDDEK